MEIKESIQQLQTQGDMIIALTAGLTAAKVRWKPDAMSWSILEVLNHLLDEEILDFRQHLDHILHKPDQSWPKIDPQGWVLEKGYNQRSLEGTLAEFKQARAESLHWLKALTAPKWDATVDLPWGRLTAGDMLASWLAHDLLHARQIVELRYLQTKHDYQPFSVQYAGEW